MKFSSPVYSQASGSVAGLTYSRNRGGLYTRARATPSNPQTEAQQIARASVSQISTRWSTLTLEQRNAWELYAASVPLIDRLGAQIQVSGINMYVRCNVPRAVGAITIIDDGPTDLTLGQTPVVTGGAADVSTGLASLNASVDGAGSGDWFLVSITRPVSPSRTPAHEPTHFIGSAEFSVGAAEVDADAFFAIAAGQAVRLWGRVTYADGRLSPWAYQDVTVVA